ncbi:MAG: hypothetical protein HZA01_08545 [Nitrospinae bacterium]|nr:hypothetical protein [Nitrospinota bacterium]
MNEAKGDFQFRGGLLPRCKADGTVWVVDSIIVMVECGRQGEKKKEAY